jgi:hypothetical protein
MDLAFALLPEPEAVELEAAADALRKLGSTRNLASFYSDTAYNAIKAGKVELARHPLEQAVQLSRELGDPWVFASVAGNVGLQALFSDDLDGARVAFEEQLRLSREHAWTSHLVAEGMAGMAGIAAHQADAERAARLLGAATTAGTYGDADVMSHFERHCFGPARAAYGEKRWNEAQAAGSRMSLEQALAYALSSAAAEP